MPPLPTHKSGINGVITLAVSITRRGPGPEPEQWGDNRCRPLSLFRCSVKTIHVLVPVTEIASVSKR